MSLFKAVIWGCTGSIATPLTSDELQHRLWEILLRASEVKLTNRDEIGCFINELPFYLKGTYHGNTPCMQIQNHTDNNLIIFDAGSGIRELGARLAHTLTPDHHIHLFLSHLHWDHIQGFPFFTPIFQKTTRMTIYGGHSNLEDSFRQQQNSHNFPVAFDKLPAEIDFVQINPEEHYKIGNYQIDLIRVPHPGGCFSYRITMNNKSIVYATDLEFRDFSDKTLRPFFDFFKEAEYLIYDSMYTVPEYVIKEDWGHSSAIIGVDVALKSNVKCLVIFHHEPSYSDKKIHEIHHSAINYLQLRAPGNNLKVITAYDGQVLDVN